MSTHIDNMYRPVFSAFCSKCGKAEFSHHLVAGDKPFTYICDRHLSKEEYHALQAEAERQFRELSEPEKHRARMAIFGVSETRSIEEQIRNRRSH